MISSWMTKDGAWYAPPDLANDDAAMATVSSVVIGLSESSKLRFTLPLTLNIWYETANRLPCTTTKRLKCIEISGSLVRSLTSLGSMRGVVR